MFGTVALAAVPAALIVRRGGAWHRRFGIVFTVAMAVVLFTAEFMWQAKGHLFLVPLSFVTAYLIFSGWRVVARRRRRVDDPGQDRLDDLAAAAVMASGLATAYLGLTASTPLLVSIAPALIGIGSIAVCFGLNDILGMRVARMRVGWKLAHLVAMIAAYISAVTAFLVINAHHTPMMLRWLVPSALGSLTIALFSLGVLRRAWPLKREIGKSAASPVARATASGGRVALD